MPNLVGIGNSQVPTNAMLGGLAYQDPAHANLTEVEIEKIAAINAKSGDTGNGVFVYNTSLDSDGGAWRKRTQGTSWYNENPGPYRGARKEFPAVAIISCGDPFIRIYDGDDPDLSLWMEFVVHNDYWAKHTISGTSAYKAVALNGVMASVGHASGRLGVVNFISDRGYVTESGYTYFHSGIANRNSKGVGPSNGHGLINHNLTYDVDMTVPNNARIDSNTGLPSPAIGVSLANGFSVIRDASLVRAKSEDISKPTTGSYGHAIRFMGENRLVLAAPLYYGIIHDVFTQEGDAGYVSGTHDSGYYSGHGNWANTPVPIGDFYSDSATGYKKFDTFGDRLIAMAVRQNDSRPNSDYGIWIHQLASSPNDYDATTSHSGIDDDHGMAVFIDNIHNTGWMHGDVHGAWLNDNISTNFDSSASNLVTNGEFATSATGHFSSTNAAGGSISLSVSSGVCTWSISGGNNYAYSKQPVTFQANKWYQVEIKVTASSGSNTRVEVNPGSNAKVYPSYQDNGGEYMGTIRSMNTTAEVQVHTCTVVVGDSDSTDGLVGFRGYQNGSVSVEYIRVREMASPSKARKYPNGAAVCGGELTKTPVAPGADLCSWSGFSATKHLQVDVWRHHDPGTGPFYFMGWYKRASGASAGETVFSLSQASSDSTSNTEYITGYLLTDGRFQVVAYSTANTITYSLSGTNNDEWHFFCVQRIHNHLVQYTDGIKTDSVAVAGDGNFTYAKQQLWFGDRPQGSAHFGGEMALWRYGKTHNLSEEQIKKIYEDEKKLFAPNAKCTLVGSGNMVASTAFDKQTGNLHVGTSTGRSDFNGLVRINSSTTGCDDVHASGGYIVEKD